MVGNIHSDLCIDHLDGDRKNNNIANLRVISHAENRKNVGMSSRNKSGRTGVRYRPDRKCWVAFYSDGEVSIQKSFSTRKYDYITAKLLAIAWRNLQIELLNHSGAGYTERHGEPR